MKRLTSVILMSSLASIAFAGFKAKVVKPKKPEQFQARTTVAEITYAADLLVEEKEQRAYFYKDLISSDIIAVRLAVFNGSKTEFMLPVEEWRLLGPRGEEMPRVGPEVVAQAVLQGVAVAAETKRKDSPVAISPGVRSTDPRRDTSDPRYDPRLDPSDPSYDPTDPRNRDRRYGDGSYGRPGVDVVLNPGGIGGGPAGDLSQYERQLIEKDFNDKAHHADSLLPSFARDRFLYYSVKERPAGTRGFTLRLPPGKGRPEEVALRF